MAVTSIRVPHSRASDYRGSVSMPARTILSHVTNLLQGVGQGAYLGGTALEVAQTCASGTLTLSGGAGTVGGTINGVAVTVTWGTSDTATATAIAAAINASASALVSNHVTASASADVVTLTAKHPGHPGNAVTLAASGTGVTASGARLTGGTSTTYDF